MTIISRARTASSMRLHGAMTACKGVTSLPSASPNPPGSTKSRCMSMTSSAVVRGSNSNSYGSAFIFKRLMAWPPFTLRIRRCIRLARAEREACGTEERVAERNERRHRPAELRAVDQSEVREDCAGKRPDRGGAQPAVDDENSDRAEHHAGEHRAAAERFESVIENTRRRELGGAELRGGCTGRSERAVGLRLRPVRDVRAHREQYRG